MRRLTCVATTVLIQLACTATAAAHARTAFPPCAPQTGVIRASNTHAQVYELFPRSVIPGAVNMYGCSRRTEHTYILGKVEGGVSWCTNSSELVCGLINPNPLALAGTVVAYVEEREGSGDSLYICVRSLVSGRILHNFPAGNVRSLVVNGEGAVAWVKQEARVFTPDGPRLGQDPFNYQLYAVDATGFSPITDQLPSEPHRLDLNGDTLTWTQNGAPETTMLD